MVLGRKLNLRLLAPASVVILALLMPGWAGAEKVRLPSGTKSALGNASAGPVAGAAKKRKKKKHKKKRKKKHKQAVTAPYLTYANAIAAIHAELKYRAGSLGYVSGYYTTYSIDSPSCAWGSGYASMTCRAFIVTRTGYPECSFYGSPGRQWSYEEVFETARLVTPSSWDTVASTVFTFRYWYCHN